MKLFLINYKSLIRGDTNITTPEGLKKLKDLTVGDIVLDGYGTPKEIMNIGSKIITDEIVRIFTNNGEEEIASTKNFKFLCLKLNSHIPKLIKASDITIGDNLFKHAFPNNNYATVTNIIYECNPTKYYGVVVKNTNSFIANEYIACDSSIYI